MSDMVLIVNPISGAGGRAEVGRQRAELARALLERRGMSGEVVVTGQPGHAHQLAGTAVARGVPLIIAWGGDGTVNEVASAMAFRDAALGIVPSGSGNGLARELGIPLDPTRALDAALDGADRRMDAGELDGRLFFNVAGIGFDARVAHQFAATGLVRRGFRRYAEIAVRELFAFRPADQTVSAAGAVTRTRPLLIAIANARQYGLGALIAPRARIDDGQLDIVIVEHRSAAATLVLIPWLFAGRIGRVGGVTMLQAAEAEISSTGSMLYHVDGEPFAGGASR
jgi:YegS/Rv2252/BmrU family lipid kinase